MVLVRGRPFPSVWSARGGFERHLIAHPDSKKIPSENDVKKKGFVVDPAPDVTRIPKCFQLDVTADSLLEMQLRLHHFNQCRLKQARRGRGELEVLFFFSPHYFVLSQYVNLKERPPFNLEAALAEHSSRDRETELERAKKVTLSSRKAEAKLSRSEAGGEKKKQKRGAADCDDDDEDDDYDEDEEAEIEWRRRKTRRLWTECATRIRTTSAARTQMWPARSFSREVRPRDGSKYLPSWKNKMQFVEVLEVAEEKEQARAKTVKEKVVKKAVVSKSKVRAKKADLKRDKIVQKAEVVEKAMKSVKSVAKNRRV